MGKQRPKKNYFVVRRGRTVGILNDWSQCERSTSGFSNAKFKGYETHDEAQKAWNEWNEWLNSQGIAPNEGTPKETLNTERIIVDLTESPERTISHGKTSVSEDGTSQAPKKAKLNVNKPTLNLDIEIPDSEPEFSDDDLFHDLVCEKTHKRVELTAEQDAVVKMAMSGDNIFLTGAAGSGKTVTLLQIIKELKGKLDDENQLFPKVQVAAPTGLAALPLNGKTTYSFAGWRPDSFKQPLVTVLGLTKDRTSKALRRLEILILEEISMVESQFLERLNLLLQMVKGNKEPFGGIQVIFLGDFYQLPPVKPFEHCMICGFEMVGIFDRVCINTRCMNGREKVSFRPGDKWAFNAPVWKQLNFRHVKLEQIHRQKDDSFKVVLNKVRNGIDLSDAEWHQLIRPKEFPPSAFPIRLMARRFDVDKFNDSQLALIQSEAKVWDAYDDSCKLILRKDDYLRMAEIEMKEEEYKVAISEWHRFPKTLTLKVGAKVVLLQNLEPKSGLVNGSQGRIVGFVNTEDWPVSKVEGEHVDWRQTQMDTFTINNPWRPVVKFANGRTSAIAPVPSETLMGTAQERYLACRTQIPLLLAWALSIHKSQGMTMEYVEVSRKDIFESGQLYVALSRATTLEGLTVTGYSREQIAMDEDVLEFYQKTTWENLQPSATE